MKTEIEGIINLVGQTGRHDDTNKVQTGEMTEHAKDRGESRKGLVVGVPTLIPTLTIKVALVRKIFLLI